MKITRRVYNKATGKVKVVTEKVELVKKNDKTVIVRLKNGDLIKRKNRDCIFDE